MFPDGLLDNSVSWAACCVEHDIAYWQGGTKADRQAADTRLKECVSELGEDDIASLMWLGVRLGGSPYFPTSFRWGYGWPYLHGYDNATDAQIERSAPDN